MEIHYQIVPTKDDKLRVSVATEPGEWYLVKSCENLRDLRDTVGDRAVELFTTSPLPDLWHGPYSLLDRAREVAYDLVGDPFTTWCVIELFGEGFDLGTDTSDEMRGQLWVVPEQQMQTICDEKDAVTYTVVDTYGYNWEDGGSDE